MNTTYGIRVVHNGRHKDISILSQMVAQELLSLGLHRSVTVAVAEQGLPREAPHVCVYLADEHAKDDPVVASQLTEEMAVGTTIFPVLPALDHFATMVPNILAVANGIVWKDEPSLRHLVHVLLEELGIEDRQRRVFISHRRSDGLWAAEQLHDTLTHHGFQPFIDRFAIREGANFQAEIALALEDHAFLLLLETPDAHTSEWVFDEIDYALSHTMGVLIVRWPGEVHEVPGSLGVPRLLLSDDDLKKDDHGFLVFTDAGLERLLLEIESAHAHGLVRRRRMLVQSIEEAATAAGPNHAISLQDWHVLVKTPRGKVVVGTTPRLPTATDLHLVDVMSEQAGADLPGILVHSARNISPSLKKHLEWVSGERALAVIPENAMGGWWSHVD